MIRDRKKRIVYCAGIYIERDYIFSMISRHEKSTIKELLDGGLFYKIPETFQYIDAFKFEIKGEKQSPERGLKEAVNWLITYKQNNIPIEIEYVSVGCYGPFSSLTKNQKKKNDASIDKNYGYIVGDFANFPDTLRLSKGRLINVKSKSGTFPQLEVRDYPLYAKLTEYFSSKSPIPEILIETDASMSALGEFHFRRITPRFSNSDKYMNNSVFFLILREGIGGSVYFSDETSSNEKENFVTSRGLYKGCIHAEIGHIRVRPVENDNFEGVPCPNGHYKCLASLASTLALLKRANVRAVQDIPPDHPALAFHAEYIAQLCASVTVMLDPSMIVLESPTVVIEGFMDKVRTAFKCYMGTPPVPNYPELERDDGGYIQTARAPVPGAYGALYHAVLNARRSEIAYEENKRHG